MVSRTSELSPRHPMRRSLRSITFHLQSQGSGKQMEKLRGVGEIDWFIQDTEHTVVNCSCGDYYYCPNAKAREKRRKEIRDKEENNE